MGWQGAEGGTKGPVTCHGFTTWCLPLTKLLMNGSFLGKVFEQRLPYPALDIAGFLFGC